MIKARIAAPLDSPAHRAADGVWSNPGGGSWAAAGNRSNARAASGSGATAGFDQLDIARPMLVTPDGNRVIGSLRFGDTFGSQDRVLRRGSSGSITFDAGAAAPEVAASPGRAITGADLTGTGGPGKTGPGAPVTHPRAFFRIGIDP